MNREIKHAENCNCLAVMAIGDDGKPYRVEWKSVCDACYELNNVTHE